MQKGIIEGVEYNTQMMNFLLFCPIKADPPNPLVLKTWLPDLAWGSVQKLIEIEMFEKFANDLEKEAPGRFKDWYNELTPESEKLPLDWKRLESMPFEKLLVIRCLRPDRITTALDGFIKKTLPRGEEFVDCDSTSSFPQILFNSY
jgi:dynein heavy chain